MRHSGISNLYLILLIMISSLLSGCETMSREECLSADWYQIGYQAGREGKERSHIEDIAASCARIHISPDRGSYFSGRERGLREYCSPSHGFNLGTNGNTIRQVCPPESANRFEAAYSQGRKVYDARQQVKRLNEKRHKLEKQLEKAESDENKKTIRNELEELDQRLRYARDTLQFIENESRRLY